MHPASRSKSIIATTLAWILSCFADFNLTVEAVELAPTTNSWLVQKCADCHSGEKPDGGLDVAKLKPNLSDPKSLYHWVRIFDRVQAGEMPPKDAEPLSSSEREHFLDQTQTWLKASQREVYESLGRVRGRRLTNLQLERTLHDLLGIDIPLITEMSVEPKSDEFTTSADNQSMSHFQLEQHLKIVDLALDEVFRRAQSEDDDSWKHEFTAKEIARRNTRCREPEYIDKQAVVWSGRLEFYGRMPATESKVSGWYRVTFQASALKKPDEHGVWCSMRTGECVSSAPLLNWVGAFEVTDKPKEFSFDVWLPKDHMIEIRPNDRTLKQGKFQGGQVANGEGGGQDLPGIGIDWLTMERIHHGMKQKEIRSSLFTGLKFARHKGEATRASDSMPGAMSSENPRSDLERLLVQFANQAFRRPVTQSEVQNYIDFAASSLDESHDLATALRTGFRAILCSPRFLYFQEKPGRLDDYAVASRLSYFLWNSMPDRHLMKLAEQGVLKQPEVLDAQVERMLHDRRGKNFVVDFAAQWLELNQIDFTDPDGKLYPDFDLVVQNSMLSETHRFLQDLLDRDTNVRTFIDADFTFLNSRLARYYELDPIESDTMQKVSLRPSDRRGGLLAQGAILKVTANGTNTSPVVRGLWVCRRILGAYVPPPPDSVPAIEPDVRGATTIRDQLEKHRSDPECAACHCIMDPPGFALENFDAAGRWRDKYLKLEGGRLRPGVDIDPSYTLRDGREFEGFEDFKAMMASNPEPIARNFAEKLLAYGTGEAISFSDRDEIGQIVDRVRSKNFGMRSIIQAVVQSEIFQTK